MMPKSRCSKFRSKFRVFAQLLRIRSKTPNFGVTKNSAHKKRVSLISFNHALLKVTNSSTRKSLKKKGGVKRSTSFFDTLGESQDLSLSAPSPLPLPLPLPPSFVDTQEGKEARQDVKEAGQEVKEAGQEAKEAGLGERSKRSSGSGGEEDASLELFPSLGSQPKVVDMLQATQALARAPKVVMRAFK